ncbi:MAG: hypothetical protein J3R72DRAFT_464058 [Linnemannia gamsii]|nr:MAG: hypothetical protein J3R72DRAFT_464058 [Linnemannia gamsii]
MKVIATFASAALLAAVAVSAQHPTPTSSPQPTPTSSPQPSWTNCAKNPILNVNSFSASPLPLCHGKPVEFTATGSLTGPIIEGARVTVESKYLRRFTVHRHEFNLCQALADAGTPCPVANIDALKFSSIVNERIIIGPLLDLRVRVNNGDGKEILCQDTTTQASNCGNPPYKPPPVTTTTTTKRPIPTPVAGNFVPCDGPQDMTISSATFTPNAWCRGSNVCVDISGTLKTNITWGTSLNLYATDNAGFEGATYGTWGFYESLYAKGQYIIPAGPISLRTCGNISMYTPERASTWELRLAYTGWVGQSVRWFPLACLKATNKFEIPPCPNA